MPIVFGTDAGVYEHGRNAGEFNLLVTEAGLTPAEALAAATTAPRNLLGLDSEVGRIAPGYSADLIAVDGNPLADVRVLEHVGFVMARGHVVPVSVDYKIAIGPWVAHRLAANPTAFKVPSNDLDIFIVRDFLTGAECAAMIALIDKERIPSQLLAPTSDPEFRTSESCNLDPRTPIVIQVERKLTDLIGIEPAHGETIQGQRYAVGQQFKPHHDFFHTDQPYWPEMEKSGGQRTWTAMMFLNEPDGGGEDLLPLGRGQGHAARGEPAGLEQSQRDRRAPTRSRSTRHAGRRRHQICDHQMAPRTPLGLFQRADLLRALRRRTRCPRAATQFLLLPGSPS